jgi:hypothetical protein
MDTGTGMRVPPRFADDPRVTVRAEGGYTATGDDGTVYIIAYSPVDRWMICRAPSEQPMPIANGHYARFYNSAAQAIAFAIGEPATTAVAA